MKYASVSRTVISGLGLAAMCLGCLIPTEMGERSEGGVCPEGETCSEATPQGLTFHTSWLFDNPGGSLRPALIGGEYELGFVTVGSFDLPSITLEIEDPAILSGRVGVGTFGPRTTEGEAFLDVDGYVALRGRGEGSTQVRILDASTGGLLDQVSLNVEGLGNVELVTVDGRERDFLFAGCEERIGVRLFAGDSSSDAARAFDSSLSLRGDGPVTPDPSRWDVFVYSVPAAQSEAEFQVQAGGETITRTLPIRSLPDSRFRDCP